MWVATKKIEHPKFTLQEGMPIPHQHHSGFRERLKQLYGKDAIKWVVDVSAQQLKKIELELATLRSENVRLKKQNEALLKQAKPPQGKVAA